MRRNEDDCHERNANSSTLNAENLIKRRFHRSEVTSLKPTCTGGDFLSLYIPLNAFKPSEKPLHIPKVKPGLRGFHKSSGHGELGREQANLETIYESDGSRQQLSPTETLPYDGYVKHSYLHSQASQFNINGDSKCLLLPYWKNADKEDPPVRTLYRAKKWVDCDEQGSKRVGCMFECERYSSKYSNCSNKSKSVTLTQREKIVFSNPQIGVCSCPNERRPENSNVNNINLIQSIRNFDDSGGEKLCFPNTDGTLGKGVECAQDQTELFLLDPRQKRMSGNSNGVSSIIQESVSRKSSKCFYIKKNCEASSLSSTNSVHVQSSAFIAINRGQVLSSDSYSGQCGHMNEGEYKKEFSPEGACSGLVRGKGSNPIEKNLGIRNSIMKNDSCTKVDRSTHKVISRDLVCDTASKPNNFTQTDKNMTKSDKEPKRVLDVLEVDTLAKANNILEKIANTLDQIKFLNQAAFSQQTMGVSNTEVEENLIDEKTEDIKKCNQTADMKTIEDNEGERSEKIVSMDTKENENADEVLVQTIDKKTENSGNEKIGDETGKQQNSWKNTLSMPEDINCGDLNVIPLKITKAISDFKSLENDVTSKISDNSVLRLDPSAKRCYSVDVVDDVVRTIKCKGENSLKKKISEDVSQKLTEIKDRECTEKELSLPLSKSHVVNESKELCSFSSFLTANARNPSCCPKEGDDKKSITSSVLQSILLTAISTAEFSPPRNNLDEAVNGNEEKGNAAEMVSANCVQPSAPSRLNTLSQPRASYVKAVKREFEDLLDKPRLERLNRMIETEGKLLAASGSECKPPVPPVRIPQVKKTGLHSRNKSMEVTGKRNATTIQDGLLKNPQLRPQTSPNKAVGDVSIRGAEGPSPSIHNNTQSHQNSKEERAGLLVDANGLRPRSSPGESVGGKDFRNAEGPSSPVAKGSQGRVAPSAANPSCDAFPPKSVSMEQGGEAKRPKSAAGKRASDPPCTLWDPTKTGKSPAGGMQQTASEKPPPMEGSGHTPRGLSPDSRGRREQSTLSTIPLDGASPKTRMRAKTCTWRPGVVRRRHRHATYSLPVPSSSVFLEGCSSALDFSMVKRAEGNPESNSTMSGLKKQLANGNVNVSMTLKTDSPSFGKCKKEKSFVKAAKDGNNQIIFNVYQVTADKLTGESSSDSHKKTVPQERIVTFPTIAGEGITSASTSENAASDLNRDKCRSGGAFPLPENKEPGPSTVRSITIPREAELAKDCTETLQRRLTGDKEYLLRSCGPPQCRAVRCEESSRLSPHGVPMPLVVGAVGCDCEGCNARSEGCLLASATSASGTDTQPPSSVPVLLSECTSEVCARCRSHGGGEVIPSSTTYYEEMPWGGEAALMNTRDQARFDVRPRASKALYRDDCTLSAPVVERISSVQIIKDWLNGRGSAVSYSHWPDEMAVSKVDVGTSVSGFNFAQPEEEAGAHENRNLLGAEGSKKEGGPTKGSSLVVMWKSSGGMADGALSECCMSKELQSKIFTPAVSSNCWPLIGHATRRRLLVIVAVYVALYSFLGWVVYLPSYYI